MNDHRPSVGWRDVWRVVTASAVQRLGVPLLRTYAMLALVGAVVVAASIAAMHL